MPTYTKLFNSIVTSTIWTEDDKTRIVWITMLAMSDKNGEVHASIPGLARVAGVSLQDCEMAIGKLLSPDEYSRTPDNEGRRIAKIDGGWELLNHAKYRLMASKEDSKAATAERVRRHRNRNAPVTACNAPVTVGRDIAEAEADTEADPKRENSTPAPEKPEWKDRLPTESAIGFEGLQTKINSLHPSWRKRPHFTRTEQDELLANSRVFFDLTDADWQLLTDYMRAVVNPDWGIRAWQPDNRGMLVKSITDVLTHADNWQRECRKRNKSA
jgi:hypothetical protein